MTQWCVFSVYVCVRACVRVWICAHHASQGAAIEAVVLAY